MRVTCGCVSLHTLGAHLLRALLACASGGTLYHLLSRLRKLNRAAAKPEVDQQTPAGADSAAAAAAAPAETSEPQLLGQARLMAYAKQVAAACSYLHKQAIVHRDLKSTNLLLSADFDTVKGAPDAASVTVAPVNPLSPGAPLERSV